MSKTSVDHFAVLGLSLSSSECEAEVDLVLIQTSFVLLWKTYLCMKNTSEHKINIIYIERQDWLYQNKVNFSFVSIYNCKIGY